MSHRDRGLPIALIAAVAVAAMVIGGHRGLAVYTSNASVGGNTFSTATLQPPSSLTATGGTSVALSWTATTSTFATGYKVLRSSTSGGPYTLITQVTPRTATTYTDSPSAGTYYYVVQAYFQNWLSVNSNEASAGVPPVLSDAVTTCTPAFATSFTWSHTVGAGQNRLLLVSVSMTQFSGATTVSSVTYSGQALVSVGSATNAGNTRAELWRLIAPPTGTANVVVTLSASERPTCAATSWSGVDQTTPLGTAATASGATTSGGSNQPSVAVSSGSNEVVQDVLAVNSTAAVTAGTGQTQQWSQSSVSCCDQIRGAGSTKAGAGTTTMAWTGVPNSTGWAIVGVSIKPAP